MTTARIVLLALLTGLSASHALAAEPAAARPLPTRDGAGGTFVSIPAGTYTIGDAVGDPDIVGHNHPHAATPSKVTLSGFWIGVTETTKGQWDPVRQWAASHGYPELPPGEGKSPNEPVRHVTWHQALTWCNAASEREGLAPAYHVKGEVYRAGTPDDVDCDWKANGYRLPTEAEWEVAARGGLEGKRFPWGDTITHAQANYVSSDKIAYDESPSRGPHPKYIAGKWAQLAPVASFAPNGYGLYDTAGNAMEWCWDWYGGYAGGENPRGEQCVDPNVHPAVRGSRILRGGDHSKEASYARAAYRHSSVPGRSSPNIGFRLVRGNVPAP